MREVGAVLALILAALSLWVPVAGHALEFGLPGGAELTHEEESPADTYFVPVGPFADGRVPTVEVEGRVIRQAWRIKGEDLTTLKLIAPLRDQLLAAGYEIMLDCVGEECGGFDFRASIEVLPAPDMLVDLFDFRFLSARKRRDTGADHVTILASVVGAAGYIQLVVVSTDADIRPGAGPTTRARVAATPATPPPFAPASALPLEAPGDLIERLKADGHVILRDVVFETGSAELAARDHASLKALAAFLKANPDLRVVLVGHTDAEGTLEHNIALSRRRAEAVLERLAERYGVPREQMEAQGVGYLAPVASNVTPEGREANRRVEAVLLNGP